MKEEREFFPAEEKPWQDIPGSPGLSERILAGDKHSADHSRMLRFAPGTVTSDTLVHEFWEEVWILEGSLTDLRLGETFTAGMYACRPPGMLHGPWETADGCITFEVRYSDPKGGK
jgi:ChrR Cupin-like domain